MSRDRRGDRTQEVIGSIPFSSTKESTTCADPRGSALLFLAERGVGRRAEERHATVPGAVARIAAPRSRGARTASQSPRSLAAWPRYGVGLVFLSGVGGRSRSGTHAMKHHSVV